MFLDAESVDAVGVGVLRTGVGGWGWELGWVIGMGGLVVEFNEMHGVRFKL